MKAFFVRPAATALFFAQAVVTANAAPQDIQQAKKIDPSEKINPPWYMPDKTQETAPQRSLLSDCEKEGWKKVPEQDKQKSQEVQKIMETATAGDFSPEGLCIVRGADNAERELDFKKCLIPADLPLRPGKIRIKISYSLFPADITEASPPDLRREIETLLSGEYVPGNLPMIYNKRGAGRLKKIKLKYNVMIAPAEPGDFPHLDKKEIADALHKSLRQQTSNNESFAFLKRERPGLWTIKVVGRDGTLVKACYSPTPNAVRRNKLNEWLGRFNGATQHAPWIETTKNGQLILHGAGLPKWEKNSQKEVLKIFTDQMMAALEQELINPDAVQEN